MVGARPRAGMAGLWSRGQRRAHELVQRVDRAQHGRSQRPELVARVVAVEVRQAGGLDGEDGLHRRAGVDRRVRAHRAAEDADPLGVHVGPRAQVGDGAGDVRRLVHAVGDRQPAAAVARGWTGRTAARGSRPRAARRPRAGSPRPCPARGPGRRRCRAGSTASRGTNTTAGPRPSPSAGMNQPLRSTPSAAGNSTSSYACSRRAIQRSPAPDDHQLRQDAGLEGRDHRPMPGTPPELIWRSSHAFAASSQSVSESCESSLRSMRMR